ncbi:MAG: DNA-processing protein DprA [Anaerolineae bacterium]|nr:DNA-processing protein DprA [Anaerolineae bacterium]
MTQFTEAASWLALLEGSDLPRRAAKQAIQQWCLEDARSMREFLYLGVKDVAEHLDLPPTVLQRMLAKRKQVPAWEKRLADLEKHDIRLLLRHETAYPDLLAERLNPIHQPFYFWYRGNIELLTEPGLLAIGATSPSGAGITFAQSLGKGAASLDVHIVGGYDKGIERIAQDAAISAGGTAVIVLPFGIERFAGALRNVAGPLQTGRLLVLSPYAPDAEISDVRSKARRSIAAALAGVSVILEPDTTPDDWGGSATLQAGHVPTYVWCHGNDDLIQAWTRTGAKLVDDLDNTLTQVAAWVAPAQETDVAEPIPLDEAQAYGVEPIRFKDADDAIRRLSQSGQVPDRLKRRLKDADWTDEL